MELRELYDNYSQLINKKITITFSCGEAITIEFKKEHFYHLSGFNKLDNARTLFKKTEHAYRDCLRLENKIKNDRSYSDIKDRIYYFNRVTQSLIYGRYEKLNGSGLNTRIKADYYITLPLIPSKYYLVNRVFADQINLFLKISENGQFYLPVSFYTASSNSKKRFPSQKLMQVDKLLFDFQ